MTITISTNGTSFRAAMESRAANLKLGAQRRIVLFAKELHGRLVQTTPKLTGKATAEWQISLNDEPTSQLLGPLRPPSQVDYLTYAAQAVSHLDAFASGDTIHITNNAPYIARLNEGYSVQAPAGYVEQCRAQALATLKATVKGISNG